MALQRRKTKTPVDMNLACHLIAYLGFFGRQLPYDTISAQICHLSLLVMGACGCTGKADLITRETLQKGIASCIETCNLDGLAELYEIFLKQGPTPYALPALTVDDPVITIQGVELNALAYAFRCGRTEIAEFLIEKAGASLTRLRAYYQVIGKTPLHILCEYGHVELLRYYLPLCQNYPQRPVSSPSCHESYEELSIFTDNPRRVAPAASVYVLSPAQKACEKGHIEIVRALKNYADKNAVFPEIDLHARDEKTGENCALVACRTGSLVVIRFLFEKCHADFSLLNKRRESAIQLVLLSAKKHSSSRYLECLQYLVEKVKVDLLYEYEETLLLIDDSDIAEYLENKLHTLGVLLTKAKVEEANAIISIKEPPSQELGVLESRLKDVGTDFELSNIFRTELQEDRSVLSSITPVSCLSRDLSVSPMFRD